MKNDAQKNQLVAGADARPGTERDVKRQPDPNLPSVSTSLVSLKSLAAGYEKAQHETYLQRLEQAVKDPKNLNIALTGRYGVGKSSVLEEFEKSHKDEMLRLAISTLGPDPDEKSLTNRIQKELVKQLIYSASPRTLRTSRFKRITPAPLKDAIVESALGVAVIGALLALVGWLPQVAWTGGGQPWRVQALAWTVVFALVLSVVTAVRQITVNRFFVSNFSAAGATVTLSERTATYFDEYLDVIVRFFDEEPKDIVILEDLDRFNDPYIFEALRELNTLLNNTPSRLKKDEPLRFVYAMRDSLFEKLGADTKKEGDDAAAAETVRANRTKFFDIVIPVVPFISHRNARELLTQLLDEAGIDGIERPLVELVAKHATDMRLLMNVRNEYLVFAERLLEAGNPAPGLTPSHLFALVSYKNFHLKDFEQISRRASDLDDLYDAHRALVRFCVSQRELRKRQLLNSAAPPRSMTPFAKRMAERLHAVGVIERDRIGWSGYEVRFTVGSETYNRDQAGTVAFWDAVVRHGTISVGATPNARTNPPQPMATLSLEHLEALFPEVLKGRWEERNLDAVREEVERLDQEVAFLRSADFRDLGDAADFTMPAGQPGEGNGDADDTKGITFAQRVNDSLKSDLARDLVKHGYIDRNFALYAAQFYGNFVGVDVATFIVQTVQTNAMDVDYQFDGEASVANLLTEAGPDFTRTVSAYNVQVLDYLLRHEHPSADDVVNQLVTNYSDDAREFLTAYFTSGNQRPQLAVRLSRRPWREVFTYLVVNEGVPADVRVDLVEAALVAAKANGTYDLPAEVRDFVIDHYLEMSAFTDPLERAQLETVLAVLERAGVSIPELEGTDETLRALVVERNFYDLTAANLRAALSVTGAVDLDIVRSSDIVFQRCLTNLDDYLQAIETDEETQHSVTTPETLAAVLACEEAEQWGRDLLKTLLAMAGSNSVLTRLTAAPKWTWQALAAAKLFDATLANVEAYRAHVGSIDESLGRLLVAAGAIRIDGYRTDHSIEDGVEEERADEAGGTSTPDKAEAAAALLNARAAIPSLDSRIQLVRSIGLDGPLAPARIDPERSELFALLIQHELVPDDAETLDRARAGGWRALKPAIIVSSNVTHLLTPNHVDGMIHYLFEDDEVSAKVGKLVVENLDTFLPNDDEGALSAAAKFAIHTRTALPLDQIRRVASNCSDQPHLTLELLEVTAPGPVNASPIVSVLSTLGTPYSHLSTRAETKFEVADSDANKAVFATLAAAGVCTFRKKRARPQLIITLV